jgi:subtilisin family serine protease
MIITPFGQALAAPDSPEKPNSDQSEKWWGDWSKDMDIINDYTQAYIKKYHLQSDDKINVIVNYYERPTKVEENKLITLGADVLYVSQYLDAIVANITVENLKTIYSWDEVVMVEFAPDGHFTLSSAIPSIGVDEVWQKLDYDGAGITVAIIDTGIDDEHAGLDDLDDDPDTDDPKVIAFYDSVNHPNEDDGTYEPYDNNGHGSHCAGIAAGTGAPQYDHIGVAPQAYLVGVKIGSGSIPVNAAIRGVEWAIANKDKFGIDILSNSWGFYIGGPANQNGQSTLSRLMDEAVNAGLSVFVAAGNTAVSLTVYAPADSEKAITVGSVNDNHVLSMFSSQGPTADGRIKPDICAVGEAVRAPNANSQTGYTSKQGTSMSCPMAAGLAALMLQAKPDLEPLDLKQIMHETSEHNTDARFPVSPNNGYGWGVVEAFGAVKRSQDLAMTFLDAPPGVHEGDTILFSANTTYTRTEFTNKGLDGMRLLGDDELIFIISIPSTWGPPFNITATSVGTLDYTANPSIRFEDNRWIIEVEYHFTQDVVEPNETHPLVTFEATTPGVDFNTDYMFFMNITLNGMNATKIAKNVTVDNQDPPFVVIDNPKDGEPVSGIVTIEGTSFDPDVGDFVDLVQIKINNNDWENTTGTDSWSYFWNTTTFNNGWYTVQARAFDGEQYSEIHNISIYLDNFNKQPQAIINLVSPNPANEGEVVSFSGYGLDDDGYIDEYEWSSNIEGVLSSADIFSTSTLAIGVHMISFRVKDNDGVWSQKDQMSLRINQIPLAFIDSISPGSATEGETINFEGHGQDDRNLIAYNWRSSLDGFLSDTPSFSKILSPGIHEIYFRVEDDDGVWSSEAVDGIRINQIPLAYIDSVTPNPAKELEEVFLSGHGSDDGTISEFKWNSSLDGLLSNTASFSSSSLTVGDHVISFRVRDNDNIWSAFFNISLEILPVPTAIIDSISPNPANLGDSVTFTGHGEDIGSIIAYQWRSDLAGSFGDVASFSTQGLSSGLHMIYFSVQNDHSVWSQEVSQVLRVNGPPTAFIDSISPNPALIGEDVLFEGHGNDDEGIVNYSWSSSIDGEISSVSSFTLNLLSAGDHIISFSVQDSDLVWSQEVSINLRIHQKPEAVIDSISPKPANENEEVIFSGHGSDDGSIVDYEWFSDLEGMVLSNSASFSKWDLKVGLHDISFRVLDNDGVWSDYSIISLRINQIPVAQIDYVSPAFANQGEFVSFLGHGIDDGDITGYSWFSSKDGFLSNSGSFSVNDLSIGNHTISFSVQDDFGIWSSDVFMDIRINQKPQAIINTFSPIIPLEGEIVSFSGMGLDDGYIAAFNWSSQLDGFLSGSNSFNTSVLSLGIHIISLRVKDNDNVWSEPTSRQLRINKMPIANIVSISPQPALSGSGISFTGQGTDDTKISEYSWSSSIDGDLGNSDSFTWYGLSAGSHIITFKVRDDDNIWSSEETFNLRVHSQPTAKILAITPDAPNENELIWFEGEGTDDGFIKEFLWTSSIEGEIGSEEVFTSILTPGTHTISFSVMDDNNEWSKEVSRKLTINMFPEAIIDFIFPNPSYPGEAVTLQGHGEDDGNIISYKWSSSIDGELGSKSSVTLLDLSTGSHIIYFKVKDNLGVWSEETTANLNVQMRSNLPPTISFVNPKSGETVYDMVFIHVEAEDEINEITRIDLRVDDDDWFKISDSAVGYYSLDSKDMSQGKHVLYVRAFDGEEYSEEEFVIVEVEQEDEEGSLPPLDSSFLIIIFFIIVPIIAAILLYWILVVRKRRRRDFIRL